jgi:hypothetical protein
MMLDDIVEPVALLGGDIDAEPDDTETERFMQCLDERSRHTNRPHG